MSIADDAVECTVPVLLDGEEAILEFIDLPYTGVSIFLIFFPSHRPRIPVKLLWHLPLIPSLEPSRGLLKSNNPSLYQQWLPYEVIHHYGKHSVSISLRQSLAHIFCDSKAVQYIDFACSEVSAPQPCFLSMILSVNVMWLKFVMSLVHIWWYTGWVLPSFFWGHIDSVFCWEGTWMQPFRD